MRHKHRTQPLIYLLACTMVYAPFFLKAQAPEGKTFDAFITKTMAAVPALPGISVAIVKDGKPVLVQGYGYADQQKNQRATAETAFYIASATKSFTGLLSLMLEAEGKIGLDKPLTTYKPFKNLKNKEVFQNITIRELLNHTSGIENSYITFREAYTGDKPLETLTMLLEEKTTVREQGKTYSYDNLGYNIFGILLKAEFGWNWQDLLQQKIFSPLSMRHTSAYMSVAEKNKWSVAWPYRPSGDGTIVKGDLVKRDNMMQAAGGLICSANDAAEWLALYQNKGKRNGKQLIAASLLEESTRATAGSNRRVGPIQDEGYGVGWFLANYKGHKLYYHNGGYPGFFSRIVQMPQHQVGIAIFANESMTGDLVSELILSFVLDYYQDKSAFDLKKYDDQTDSLVLRVSDAQARIKQQYESLSQRPWKLTLPKKAFCGTYFNQYIGKVTIEEQQDELIVKMGELTIKATPYTQDNSIRIQIGNTGSVMTFKTEDNRVVAMQYRSDSFEKTN